MNVHSMDRPDKREDILQAAMELFGELGFHGTAVPQVAEKARVGAGTIYRYFPSKEALVNEVYRLWKGKMGAAILDGFPVRRLRPRAVPLLLVPRALAFALANPKALIFLELHHHAPYLDAQSRAVEEALLVPRVGDAGAWPSQGRADEGARTFHLWLLMSIVWGSLRRHDESGLGRVHLEIDRSGDRRRRDLLLGGGPALNLDISWGRNGLLRPCIGMNVHSMEEVMTEKD